MIRIIEAVKRQLDAAQPAPNDKPCQCTWCAGWPCGCPTGEACRCGGAPWPDGCESQ